MPSFNDQSRPPPITYGCICSGISAPTLAAQHLGWKTQFFSEIEAFPRAVLKHRFPSVPLHSNFTTIQKDTYGTIDLLVGGCPCQSFSVAGKRLGLDDPRGNLTLEYVSLAGRLDAKWMVYENVPGLLSSAKGEDFAAFISAITGFDYRPPATGWKNAGIAEGKPGRWGIAWRVLNAEHFGVPQRRRRIFLVGYRGDANWRAPAAILLEPESMRGDSPPSRQTRTNVAALTATGVGTCGADDNQAQAGHLIASTGDTSHCLNAGGMGRQDYETETLIAHTLRGDGFDASEDGTGRGTPLVPVAFAQNSRDELRFQNGDGSIAGALSAQPGMKQTTYLAFSCKDDGRDSTEDISPTIRSMGHHGSHANGGGQVAIAMSLRGREGGGTAELAGEQMPALRASQGGGDKPHLLQGFTIHGTDKTANAASYTEVAGSLCARPPGGIENSSTTAMLYGSAVRRLTVEECESLMGMPRGYTRIPWRGKPASECPDGNRYKAIGNSMAVPCIRWIFERLEIVNRTLSQ